MKKLIYSILVAGLTLAASACQSIDEQEFANTLNVTDTIVNFESTKVSYAFSDQNEPKSGLKASWEVGDSIFGFDDQGGQFTFTVSEVNAGKASFSTGNYVPANGVTKLYAVYCPGKTAFNTDNELEVDLSSQDGTLDSESPAVMCATGTIEDNNVAFDFANQTSIVGIYKMQIKDGDTPVANTTITGVTLNNVATTGTVKLDGDELKLVPGTGVSSISASGLSLTTDNDGYIEATSSNLAPYFAVIPAKAKMSISATDGTNIYNNLSTISESTLTAGKYYYIGKILGTTVVATIGTTGYATIDDAFRAANAMSEPATITMLADCTPTTELLVDKNDVVLDLNGNTLTCSYNDNGDGGNNTTNYTKCRLRVVDGKNLEITDSSSDDVTEQGSIVAAENADFTIVLAGSGSTLNISGGNITNNYSNAVWVVTSNFNMTGGKVIGSHNGNSCSIKLLNEVSDTRCKATVSGGIIESDIDAGINVVGGVELIITGGSINFTNSTGVVQKGGLVIEKTSTYAPVVSMNGGTIELKSAGKANSYAAVYVTGGELKVNSGSIINSAGNGCAIRCDGGTVTVNGKNHPDYVEDGDSNPDKPVISNNGSWGGVYGNGGTINLYQTASYSVSAAVPFGRIRKGTLNIKGGTFKSSGTNGAFYIDAGANGSPVINMTGGLAYVENAIANATYPVFRLECGTFNLSGGLIGKTGQSGSGDARIASYRSITMSNAKLIMKGGSLLCGRNAIYAQGNSDISIEGGTLAGSLSGDSYNLINLSKSTDKATISGGNFATNNSTTPIFTTASGASLTITGGKYTSNAASTVANRLGDAYTTTTISESFTINADYSITGTQKTYTLTTEVVQN